MIGWATRGYGAYFAPAFDLMEDLRKARSEHNLDRRMRVYLAPKVLIVDEFGIWPYDRECATAFLTLVSLATNGVECYSPPTRASSNGANFWGMRSSPPLLRSHVLNIRGESYRLKDKRQAGIFPPSTTGPGGRAVQQPIYTTPNGSNLNRRS